MSYAIINLDDVNPLDEKNMLVFLEQVASGCASGKFSEWIQLRPAIRNVLARLEAVTKERDTAIQTRASQSLLDSVAKGRSEAQQEVETLKLALKKAKQLIHSEYCSTDCSFHDFIDTILNDA